MHAQVRGCVWSVLWEAGNCHKMYTRRLCENVHLPCTCPPTLQCLDFSAKIGSSSIKCIDASQILLMLVRVRVCMCTGEVVLCEIVMFDHSGELLLATQCV